MKYDSEGIEESLALSMYMAYCHMNTAGVYTTTTTMSSPPTNSSNIQTPVFDASLISIFLSVRLYFCYECHIANSTIEMVRMGLNGKLNGQI
jgi:hypothetical protein